MNHNIQIEMVIWGFIQNFFNCVYPFLLNLMTSPNSRRVSTGFVFIPGTAWILMMAKHCGSWRALAKETSCSRSSCQQGGAYCPSSWLCNHYPLTAVQASSLGLFSNSNQPHSQPAATPQPRRPKAGFSVWRLLHMHVKFQEHARILTLRCKLLEHLSGEEEEKELLELFQCRSDEVKILVKQQKKEKKVSEKTISHKIPSSSAVAQREEVYLDWPQCSPRQEMCPLQSGKGRFQGFNLKSITSDTQMTPPLWQKAKN